MFLRTLSSSSFLRNVFGSAPFVDYCRERGIAFDQASCAAMQKPELLAWVAALTQLPPDKQAQVELELATVGGMADHGSIAQLLQGIQGKELPSDAIPGDTALALWFFLRHRQVFNDVFLGQEIEVTESWWNAQATPDVALDDLHGKAAVLALRLREVFRLREGTVRYCAVDARRVNGAYAFVARVSDRLQFVDVFTESGEYSTQAVQPALPLIFVYYPLDGTILLQTRLTARDRLLECFQLFAQVVLGAELDGVCMKHAFNLGPLKERFDPLLDAPDMESVRVKTLHFRYPERHGRRQVKLETIMSDDKFAILEMIQSHMSCDESALSRMCVSHAELQIKLKVNGGSKSYLIQLWPNRCSLGQAPLDERFRASLKKWGLYVDHAREP